MDPRALYKYDPDHPPRHSYTKISARFFNYINNKDMGALSKFFLSPIYKVISVYFSRFLPEALRFLVLSAFVLYCSYRRESSRSEYMAVINRNSSRFVYKRKCFWSFPLPDPPECSICLSEYQEGDVARKLRCSHTFHHNCVDKWLQGSQATCPLCRSPVVPEEIVSEHRRSEDVHQLLKKTVEEELALILLSTMNAWNYHSGFF